MNIYHPAKRCDPLRMDIYAIRKQNLLALLNGKKQRACAEKWDTSPSTLSQITSANAVRNLGDELARKIERAEGLPAGWMDTLQADGSAGVSNVEGNPARVKDGLVPVVGMAQLGTNGYFEALDFPVGHGDGYVRIYSDDPNAYALKVVGDSMEPRIRSGEYVLIEPNRGYLPGDEVLVKTADGQSMIKVFMYCRDGMVRLLSVNDQHSPLTLPEASIEKIHPVGAILKASRLVDMA